jgi:hypothetical protein
VVYEMKTAKAKEKLQEAIAAFPRTPAEYNKRQRDLFAKKYWRRFNLRAIGITAATILTTLFVIR